MINVNDNYGVQAPKPIDSRYGPYIDISSAILSIPIYQRFLGLTIGVGVPIVEYWWVDGLLDGNLVEKETGGGNVESVNGQTGVVVLDANDVGAVDINGTYINPTWIQSLAWTKITSTPTSLAGYGITDPIVLSSNTYSNPNWITSLSWSKITNTPTTIAGYNIVDATPNTRTLSINGVVYDLSNNRSWSITPTLDNVVATNPTTNRRIFVGGISVNTSFFNVHDSGNVTIGNAIDTGIKLDVDGIIRMKGTFNMYGDIYSDGTAGRGQLVQQTLFATTNNDTLVGIDLVPTYNVGSYTNVNKIGIRVLGGNIFIDSDQQSTINNGGLLVKNNNNTNSTLLTLWNPNTGTTSLTSMLFIHGNPASLEYGGQISYAPSNYVVAQYQRTMIYSAIGNNKVLFVNNASAVSGLTGEFIFTTSALNAINTMTIKGNGNILINTNTDSGYKMDINGTLRVQQSVQFARLSADPTGTLSGGMVYYNTTTNKLRVRTNSAWVDLH